MDERLVLWDIDKTLLDVDGIGFEIFSRAFAQYTGISDHTDTHGPGRTEWQWFHETLTANGIAVTADAFTGFLNVQDTLFRARSAEMVKRGRVLAGARDLLQRCHDDPAIVSSLLTGNTRRNAERKLSTFGLDHLVDFDAGGYGDDHIDRSELVGTARRRAYERTGIEFTPDTTVLVGDSPNDVFAAHAGGSRVIAVATGVTDAMALHAAGADTVLQDLSDPDTIMTALTG